jgi:DUF4097 and DUF4098 domain-containing protein YvlB
MEKVFIRTFTVVLVFTFVCFGVSYGLARAAADGPFPKAVIAKIINRANADLVNVELEQKFSPTKLKSVEVSAGAANIKVKRSEGSEIIVRFSGYTEKDKKPMEYSVVDGKLRVEVGKNQNQKIHFHLGEDDFSGYGISGSDSVVVAEIPESYLGEVTLETSSGDTSVANIKSKKLVAKLGSGDIRLKNVSADQLKVSTGSGDVDIQTIDSKNADVHVGSGDVTARIGDIKNWSVSLATGSGDVYSDFAAKDESSKKTHSHEYGEGKSVMKVKTGSGDITLKM